ncbi:MAG: AAA family ATPase [Spirochaetaceae bacterium]|nr:AAA family ATPase [Spirochaetaceae bacterium]
MLETKYTWIPYYTELAQKVLEFKDRRGELMDIIYSLPNQYTKFLQWMPENGEGVENPEIDPFSIFCIFNRGWTDANRMEILSHLKAKLDIKAEIPQDFASIPLLDNRKSFFRSENSPDYTTEMFDLFWNLFEAVVLNTSDFQVYFDQIISLKHISYGLTFMMFCINPSSFISLDKGSRTYLKNYGIDVDNVPNGKQYIELINLVKEKMTAGEILEKSFMEFSNISWKQEPKEKSKIKRWTYAAGENSRLWKEFYDQGLMAIGWDEIANLKDFANKEEIKKELVDKYNKNPNESAKNDTNCLWQFANEIHIGDIIYVKSGRKQLIGRGVVESDYYIDCVRSEYIHCRKVNWTNKGEWDINSQTALKTLTDITPYTDMWKEFENTISGNKDITVLDDIDEIPLNQILYGPPGTGKTYETKKLAVKICEGLDLNERNEISNHYKKLVEEGRVVFTTFHQSMSYEDFIEGIKPITKDEDGNELDTMKYKVLPGIFKKICEKARKSSEINGTDNFDEAWLKLMDYLEENESITVKSINGKADFTVIQNTLGTGLMTSEEHPKYFSKEQLYRIYKGQRGVPAGGHDNYRKAIVENFMKREISIGLKTYVAPENAGNKQPYLLIIDEINRGNIPQIFGELITLIEESKRERASDELSVTLPYSGELFSVPSNLYILGTMNTADRSIEALDTALRRRFTFVEKMPDTDKLEVIDGIDLSTTLNTMNSRLEYLLDRDHTIGHAYFINAKSIDDIRIIFANKIIPQLQEYFYTDWKKTQLVLGNTFIKEKNKTNVFGNIIADEYIDLEKKQYEISPSDEWDFTLNSFIETDQ